jgi:hypothetical protein
MAPKTATPTVQVIDSQASQAHGRGDHDGRERGARQVAQELRRDEEQQRDRHGAHYAGELRLRTRSLGHRRSRRAAADGDALEESRGEVRGSQANHLLVRIHARARLRGIGPRQDAGIREGQERHDNASHHDRNDVVQGDER